MEITSIQNKLIIYKNNNKLPAELVKEIQDTLLGKKVKKEDLLKLLNKIEEKLNKVV